MESYSAHGPIRWLITIVDRGKGEKVAKIYRENHLFIHIAVLGIGTAQSEIMDYLGLDEPEKDIVLTLVPDIMVTRVLQNLDNKMQFYRPGSGVAFTIPLSGISAAASRQAEEGTIHIVVDREVSKVEKKQQYDLVTAVVDRGQIDLVMDAAKAAGATGGTIIRARGIDSKEAEKFLKITIQPEKEIVAIITAHEQKQTIMKGICNQILSLTGERGIVFSIPIEDVTGLRSHIDN